MEKKGWQKEILSARTEKTIGNVCLIFVGVIGIALFGILFAVMFNKCSEIWVMNILDIKEKQDVIKFIGLGIAGILAFFGAVAVNRRADAQVKVADAQVENNELIERGHIQERFKTAVEHLGGGESVRIASFYEFSHLASDNEELRKNIFDILCAHLRQTTSDKEYKEKVGVVEKDEELFEMEKRLEVRHTEEVQSLLDVLFKSKGKQGESVFVGLEANLQRIFLTKVSLQFADLQGADLREAELQGADLQWAKLQKAKLWSAKLLGVSLLGTKLEGAQLPFANLLMAELRDADLRDADLQYADLRGAKLERVDLRNADLRYADLRGAKLEGVDLREAKLQEADLRGAKLEGVDLREAKLQGAKLQRAKLQEAKLQRMNLRRVNLQEVNLQRAKLQGVDLQYADLREADLRGANLREADLRGANLRGVDLQEAIDLETANLSKAKIKGAKFPEGYQPPDDADFTSDDD